MNMLADKRYSKFSFIAFFIIVILLSFTIVAPFLIAIIAGALFAQMLSPMYKKLVDKNVNPRLSATLVLIFFILLLVVPLFFFLQMLITETGKFIQMISASDLSVDSITEQIKSWQVIHHFIADPASLSAQLKNLTASLVEMARQGIIYLAGQIPSFIIDTIFFLLSIFVFLLNGEKIKNFISNLIPLDQEIKNGLMDSSHEINQMAGVGSIFAALGQTTVMLIGFLVLGIPNVLFASLATFILSFIPFLGSAPIWIAGVVYLIFKGTATQIVLMVIIGIITSVIDNVIRSFLLNGSKSKLHPFIAFIAVIGGIKIFGLFGILIGPIIAALLLSMCKMWPDVLQKK